jgi:hypothetical protein
MILLQSQINISACDSFLILRVFIFVIILLSKKIVKNFYVKLSRVSIVFKLIKFSGSC